MSLGSRFIGGFDEFDDLFGFAEYAVRIQEEIGKEESQRRETQFDEKGERKNILKIKYKATQLQ